MVGQKMQFVALTGATLTLLIATSIRNLSFGLMEENGTSPLQIISIFQTIDIFLFLERPIY